MQYRQHRDVKHPTRYYSNKQEKSIATAVDGKQVANSGATPYHKGDVTTDKWLFEAKTKMKPCNSFSIKKHWLDKNLEESIFMKKPYNALVFNFGPDTKNYYVVDEQTFLEMREALEQGGHLSNDK